MSSQPRQSVPSFTSPSAFNFNQPVGFDFNVPQANVSVPQPTFSSGIASLPPAFNFTQPVMPQQSFSLSQQQNFTSPIPSYLSPQFSFASPQASDFFGPQTALPQVGPVVEAVPEVETPTVASAMRESLGLDLSLSGIADQVGDATRPELRLSDDVPARLAAGETPLSIWRDSFRAPATDAGSVADAGDSPDESAPRSKSPFTDDFLTKPEALLDFSTFKMPGFQAEKANYNKIGEANTDPEAVKVRSDFEAKYTGVEEGMPLAVHRLQQRAGVDALELDENGNVTADSIRVLNAQSAQRFMPEGPADFWESPTGAGLIEARRSMGDMNARAFEEGNYQTLLAAGAAIDDWENSVAEAVVNHLVSSDPDGRLVQVASGINTETNPNLLNDTEAIEQTLNAHQRVYDQIPEELRNRPNAVIVKQNLDQLRHLHKTVPARRGELSSLVDIGVTHRDIVAGRLGDGYNADVVNRHLRTDPGVMHAHSRLQEAIERGAPSSELDRLRLDLTSAVSFAADAAGKTPTGNTDWLRGRELADGTWERDSAYWQTVMGVGAFGMMLLAPLERQYMYRKERKDARSDWERQKDWAREQMELQHGYRMGQIGAQGEASQPRRGTPSGVNVARF